MKKNLLSAAVATGSVVLAQAALAQTEAYINTGGTGEALIYPLYTAQNGNDTYIHVVNTTGDAKAVKVRIIEAENSVETLDFNLYLSAEDHFAFAITADGDGAKLVTTDNSCTVPIIPEAGTTADGKTIREVSFRDFGWEDDSEKDDPETDADESFDNTGEGREQVGYVEVIEMGQLDASSDALVDERTGTGITNINVAAAVTHGADGVPANCDIPVAGWSSVGASEGQWVEDVGSSATNVATSEFQATWNGGGLYGIGTIINVAEGTSFGEDAVAIAQLMTPNLVAGTDNVAAGSPANDGGAGHYAPGSTKPDFNDTSVNDTALVSSNAGGGGQVMTFDGAAAAKFRTVSSLLMVDEVMNDYVIDPALSAQTDWVLTMPTKHFHINADPIIEPFNVAWNGQNACEPSKLLAWDREEANPAPLIGTPDFSPKPEVDPENDDLLLCYEMTVLQFGDESVTNNDSTATGVGALLSDYTDGWAKLTVGPNATYGKVAKVAYDFQRTLTSANDIQLGLPITGFAAIEYTNGNMGGVVANYAFSTEHKTNTTIS